MPAQIDDPTTPAQYRRSGVQPFPTAQDPTQRPAPKEVKLRDGKTTATIFGFTSPTQLSSALVRYMWSLLSDEIRDGNTYPMIDPLPLDTFAPYWFGIFGTLMVRGTISEAQINLEEWRHHGDTPEMRATILGTFYVKPNYPGRSSHVCNAGFLVSPAARGLGVGRAMGECYLEWAPQLGYTYSVFNLVYETNVASCRIWDGLGFDRIGRVPGCGNLRSSKDKLVDSIVYGKVLSPRHYEIAGQLDRDRPKEIDASDGAHAGVTVV